jgi:hypothetical protein
MKWIIVPIFILLSLSTALAQTYEYCSDNTTLTQVRQVVINVPERNVTRTINATENKTCEWGCDPERNACNLPSWIYIGVIIALLVVAYFVFVKIIYPMVTR